MRQAAELLHLLRSCHCAPELAFKRSVVVEAIASRSYLLSRAARIVGERELAEDLFHSVIERALIKGVLVADARAARAWILTAIRHLRIRLYRDACRARRREAEWTFCQLSDRDPISRRSDDVADPQLIAAACQLSPSQRAVTLLQFGGMSRKAISELLNVSEGAVKTFTAKAKRRLRQILAPDMIPPPLPSRVERLQLLQSTIALRLEKQTLREISRKTGLPMGTVSAYLSEARASGVEIPYVRPDKIKGANDERK